MTGCGAGEPECFHSGARLPARRRGLLDHFGRPRGQSQSLSLQGFPYKVSIEDLDVLLLGRLVASNKSYGIDILAKRRLPAKEVVYAHLRMQEGVGSKTGRLYGMGNEYVATESSYKPLESVDRTTSSVVAEGWGYVRDIMGIVCGNWQRDSLHEVIQQLEELVRHDPTTYTTERVVAIYKRMCVLYQNYLRSITDEVAERGTEVGLITGIALADYRTGVVAVLDERAEEAERATLEGLNEAEKKRIEAEKKLYAFTQPSQATSPLDHRLKPLGFFYAAAEEELRALGESMRRNREREYVARDLAEVLGPRGTTLSTSMSQENGDVTQDSTLFRDCG